MSSRTIPNLLVSSTTFNSTINLIYITMISVENINAKLTTFASTQGIFYLVSSNEKLQITGVDKSIVRVGRTKVEYDDKVVKPIFVLDKDSQDWRKIIHSRYNDGIFTYGIYNNDLKVIDHSVYAPASILSLQIALGFKNCIVFSDVNNDLSDSVNSNTPASLINISRIITAASIKTTVFNPKRTIIGSNRQLAEALAKRLTKFDKGEVHKDENSITILNIIFTPQSLKYFLNMYEYLSPSEKEVVFGFISNVINAKHDTL